MNLRTLATSRKHKRALVIVGLIVVLLFVGTLLQSNDQLEERKSESKQTKSPGPLEQHANRKPPSTTRKSPSAAPTSAATESFISNEHANTASDKGEGSVNGAKRTSVKSRLQASGRYTANSTVLHVVSHHHWDR
jgi:cytoskeletal protein RodZ